MKHSHSPIPTITPSLEKTHNTQHQKGSSIGKADTVAAERRNFVSLCHTDYSGVISLIVFIFWS